MQTQEDAFLADIAEHPQDDTPRLIYADWLEDAGDVSRAEFIRLQIERSRLAMNDVSHARLASREGALLLEYENHWREQLPILEGVNWYEFARGFVETVFVESVDHFLAAAPHIFTAAPIRRLQIGHMDGDSLRKLMRSEYLSRLCELNLGNNPIGMRGIRTLAESPFVRNLQVLLLHYCNLGDEAVTELACSTNLRQLEELYLSGNDLGDRGVTALSSATTFPLLRDLDLRDNRISDPGAFALAEGTFHSLATLYLVNNLIGPSGCSSLANTSYLPQLARLYLNYNPLGNVGAIAFANSEHRQALRDLDLRHGQIRDLGGRALALSSRLDGVQFLWLGGNRLRMETLTLLRRRFGDRLKL